MALMIGISTELNVKPDIATTYAWVIHPDTPKVLLTRWGPLAGFAGYELTSGDWTLEGSIRRITLSDGSQMTETIKTLNEPIYYDYELTEFAPLLMKSLFKRAYSQWWFAPRNDGSTHVIWRYSFEPANPLLAPVVWLFVQLIYRWFLAQAASNMVRISEETGLVINPKAPKS